MIKIKTSDLKNFIRRTKGIKQNGVMPILDYFKLDCIGDRIVITETNGYTYVIHEMPGESEKNGSWLIDRKIISSIVETTKSETITITPKGGKKIIISDELGNNGFQTDDPTLYHKVPDRGNASQAKISPELMKAIQVAKHYCINDPKTVGINPLDVVHIVGTPDYSEVFASDRFRLYVEKVFGDGVTLMLYPDNCNLLAGFEEAIFYESGNYNFFECGLTTYGFIKPEFKTPDFGSITRQMKDGEWFQLEKEKITSFCNRAAAINPSGTFALCEIRDAGKNKLLFSFNNADHDVDCDMTFDVEKNFTATDFKFNADTMLKVLNPLPFEKIIFVPGAKMYYLKSDENKQYIGCIIGLV